MMTRLLEVVVGCRDRKMSRRVDPAQKFSPIKLVMNAALDRSVSELDGALGMWGRHGRTR